MWLRRGVCLLLMLLSLSFATTVYQTFIWRLHPYYFLIEPILLFSVPLLLISTYLLIFPGRLWGSRARPFFGYTSGLLAIGFVVFTFAGGRMVPEAEWFWLVPALQVKGATIVLAFPMWLLFIGAVRTPGTRSGDATE